MIPTGPHAAASLTLLIVLIASTGGCHRRVASVAPGALPAPRQELSAPAAESVRERVAQAWPQRDDVTTLAELIVDMEALLARNDEDVALAEQLGHAYFLQAQGAKARHDRALMKNSLARGVLVCERALVARYPIIAKDVTAADSLLEHLDAVDRAGLDALTWYVSNLGAYAASRGVTSLMFYRDRVTALLQRMLVLDETYLFGTPHRYMGIYLSRAPAFAGGDLEQARIHFERALAVAPQYAANLCDYAQYYAVPKKDRALFVSLLTRAREADAAMWPEAAAEMRLEQARAQRLLSDVERLF